MAVATDILPSLYEYYTGGGINSGLDASKPYFTLNDRNITIYSGAMHYFRVPKQYWRNRLRKMRAAGLNAVETYVPWNLHEPEQGRFDFGDGGSDMQEFLNVTEFLKTAQEEDLLAIVRPGPYICSEFEFGGFPSWLLRQKGIIFRTSEKMYMKFVTRYFNILLPILAALQFIKGGPIVAFQVENEYGSTSQPNIFTPDKVYLRELRNLFITNGITELLVTSDSPLTYGNAGTIPDLFLQTANFGSDPEAEFLALKLLQPNRPIMAMEFWTGWFDHWSEVHHKRSSIDFYNIYERILKCNASVNMYMFHGGTSFGFLNGANLANSNNDNLGFQPDTTSYDYDAPLSESGDYTIKYILVKQLLARYNPILTRLPETPSTTYKETYSSVKIESQLILSEILDQIDFKLYSENVLPMELLPINNLSGQSYGYIVYRKWDIDIPANSVLVIKGGIRDTATLSINGTLKSKPLETVKDLNGFGFWRNRKSVLHLGSKGYSSTTLDIMVENWGRSGFGRINQFYQYKGLLNGTVFINNQQLSDWEIVPLEFKKSWTRKLEDWHPVYEDNSSGPALYKATLNISNPQDTYVDMRNWCKGIVIVNNFVLGRYSRIGPQQTLYLPAPFLRNGTNEILIFEHYKPYDKVEFIDHPVYCTRFSKSKTVY